MDALVLVLFPLRMFGPTNARLSSPFVRLQENHHCNLAFKLIMGSGILTGMENPDKRVRASLCTRLRTHTYPCNHPVTHPVLHPLINFPSVSAQTLRTILVESILNTDLVLHKTMVETVKARLASAAAPGGKPLRGASDLPLEDRTIVVPLLLHAADLHTPIMEPAMAQRLAELVGMEFEAQAEMEIAMGLPVSVMRSRDVIGKASMELGFIQFVARGNFRFSSAPPHSPCAADHERS